MGGFFLGEGGMYKREDIIIVPIQTFPLSILAFSPLPPWQIVTSRDNHWWRHSLAYVVEDGVWYTLRVENFYYRNVGGNASPPQQKVFVFWRGTTAPFPPSLFWCLCITNENVGESKLPFLKKSENNDIFGKQFNYSSFLKEITFSNPLTF